MMSNIYLDFSQGSKIYYNASKDEVSLAGIIVYNNKGSTNLSRINKKIKIVLRLNIFLTQDETHCQDFCFSMG